ncbi:hypothetical protein SLE2022_184930 [Rubroshorea leprosula]
MDGNRQLKNMAIQKYIMGKQAQQSRAAQKLTCYQVEGKLHNNALITRAFLQKVKVEGHKSSRGIDGRPCVQICAGNFYFLESQC